MFSFLDYTWEIWTVGAANNVGVGVAFDRFSTDIKLGKALLWNTGNALPDFDFAAAKDEWDRLTVKERAAACEEWHGFIDENYDEVCKAFAKGPEAIAALAGEWRARNE